MAEVSRAFRAMNTDVLAAVVASPRRRVEAAAALREVERLFAEIETALSRFRPTSELSALNRAAGRPFRASPLLYTVVAEALAAARATDGLFDPTVLGALVAAGYDRSFELIEQRPASDPIAPSGAQPSASADCEGRHSSWRDIRLDPEGRTITLPAGLGLDLGGIGKGWTVDRAVERLRRFGSFAIDAGGDLYAAGSPPGGTSWTVGVADPSAPGRDIAVLAIRNRAVATSTVARRRWVRDGTPGHHLIDPRTGRPAESGVLSVTVVAESVARAEVLAKVALLLGPEAGLRLLDEASGAAGLLVLADGRVEMSARLREVQRVA